MARLVAVCTVHTEMRIGNSHVRCVGGVRGGYVPQRTGCKAWLHLLLTLVVTFGLYILYRLAHECVMCFANLAFGDPPR